MFPPLAYEGSISFLERERERVCVAKYTNGEYIWEFLNEHTTFPSEPTESVFFLALLRRSKGKMGAPLQTPRYIMEDF